MWGPQGMKIKVIFLLAGSIAVLLAAFYYLRPVPVVQDNGAIEVKALPLAAVSSSTSSPSIAIKNNAAFVSEPPIAGAPSGGFDAEALVAKLALSEDNGKIEFVKNTQGVIIKELDQDPASISFQKPLREYGYLNGKVNSMTRYEYSSGKVTAYKLHVAYDSAGEVSDYRESSTTHDFQ